MFEFPSIYALAAGAALTELSVSEIGEENLSEYTRKYHNNKSGLKTIQKSLWVTAAGLDFVDSNISINQDLIDKGQQSTIDEKLMAVNLLVTHMGYGNNLEEFNQILERAINNKFADLTIEEQKYINDDLSDFLQRLTHATDFEPSF
jgi:hypothetical protein